VFVKVHLALDLWTSKNGGSFLGIKLYHTVEDVGVKSVTLAVEPVEGEHSADNLKGIVIAVANRFQGPDLAASLTSSTRWKSTYYMLTQSSYLWLPMTTFEQNSKTQLFIRCS